MGTVSPTPTPEPLAPYAAAGDWKYTDTVTLVAKSASKVYDGKPLVGQQEVKVTGLPEDFTIEASANGSQTVPGSSYNTISDVVIRNAYGEDVTEHFVSLLKVNGMLYVMQVPMTIWTGSASKEYDGAPLTSALAGIRGMEENPDSLGFVYTDENHVESLYVITGSMKVCGLNPLTREWREQEVEAGERVRLLLAESAGSSFLWKERVSEGEVPEEILRLFLHNMSFFVKACQDAGWNYLTLEQRMAGLWEEDDMLLLENKGLWGKAEDVDKVVSSPVGISFVVDASGTSYAGRDLVDTEARFEQIELNPGLSVAATGSQTEVGSSSNTYAMNWAGEDPAFFRLAEDVGVLNVTASTRSYGWLPAEVPTPIPEEPVVILYTPTPTPELTETSLPTTTEAPEVSLTPAVTEEP